MLAGLLPPTAGRISVLGLDATTRMRDIRRTLGVCPQHDVLWPELTVTEHLRLFAEIKQLDESTVPAAVAKSIADVGLTEKSGARAGSLSGGQKRKLSVAIALLGGSKVVFLDEPTSGMDPYSRRSTWNILQANREGRIMVLTTHFMDEADVLADRIAIMADGALRCCGSAMFLKRAYGVGYILTAVKAASSNGGCDAGAVLALVREYVPAATLHSNVGAELAIRLPMAASLAAMCEALEARSGQLGLASLGISVTTLEEVFLRIAGQEGEQGVAAIGDASRVGAASAAPNVSPPPPAAPPDQPHSCDAAPLTTVNPHQRLGVDRGNPQATAIQSADKALNGVEVVRRRARREGDTAATFCVHLRALLLKRLHAARRDKKSLCFQLLIPALVVLGGLALIQVAIPAPYPDYQLSTAQFNVEARGDPNTPIYPNVVPATVFKSGAAGGGTGPGPTSQHLQEMLGCLPAANVSAASPRLASAALAAVADPLGLVNATAAGQPTRDMQRMAAQLLDIAGQYDGSRFGAYLFTAAGTLLPVPGQPPAAVWLEANGSVPAGAAMTYAVFHNSTARHAAPVFLNLLHSAAYAASQGDACAAAPGAPVTPAFSITARNHPLPFTSGQTLLLSSYLAGSAATIQMIAFAFIPASLAAFAVKERETGAKHQQLLSGVSIPAYWVSAWIWDTLTFIVPGGLVLGLYQAFSVAAFVSPAAHRLHAFVTLLALYGPSVSGFTYLLSHAFTSHSGAQNGVLYVNLGAVLAMIVSMIMGQAVANVDTCAADSGLRYVYRLLPGFGLGTGLYALAFLDILPSLNANCARGRGELTVSARVCCPIHAQQRRFRGPACWFYPAQSPLCR
jgi:ATP-binding cassette subfamily A (ABC1) protein 3